MLQVSDIVRACLDSNNYVDHFAEPVNDPEPTAPGDRQLLKSRLLPSLHSEGLFAMQRYLLMAERMQAQVRAKPHLVLFP